MTNFLKKYIKYKLKYLKYSRNQLNIQVGGTDPSSHDLGKSWTTIISLEDIIGQFDNINPIQFMYIEKINDKKTLNYQKINDYIKLITKMKIYADSQYNLKTYIGDRNALKLYQKILDIIQLIYNTEYQMLNIVYQNIDGNKDIHENKDVSLLENIKKDFNMFVSTLNLHKLKRLFQMPSAEYPERKTISIHEYINFITEIKPLVEEINTWLDFATKMRVQMTIDLDSSINYIHGEYIILLLQLHQDKNKLFDISRIQTLHTNVGLLEKKYLSIKPSQLGNKI